MRKLILIGIAALAIVHPLRAAPAAGNSPPSAKPAGVAQAVTVTVDTDSTKAVLDAVLNPALTMAEALRIAALPGNQGLIRKARSYGRPGTDELFAKALVAAAQRDDAAEDPGKFRFGPVREHAAQIRTTLAKLEDPASNLLARVKARIAEFTPPSLNGHVTGYLIVGGTSGGFAFGGPEFFLNLDRFPSAALAATIMEHELFHAIQGIARTSSPPADAACLAKIPHSEELSRLFMSLEMEGSASLVGDVPAIPAGTDEESDKVRKQTLRRIDQVGQSITLLELSTHGLRTGAQVSYGDIYALGFYGDEVLYTLGYVMARAIAAEEGKGAIAALTGRPGALFVQRYRKLKGYGKSEDVPVLFPATLQAAEQLAACAEGAR
ncbi:DUF5700 domain-containing putative Zn-dependent protease [Massilia sp. UBA6681]|uniref:DUF5700 domain-containing putative Zn-dependent protease n=1 Tax=Massilia sp. UBA6681 TaxID=1946839 RepID=UPI0025C51490|nr:DUF5700 domain-containing putative Zn-dependent protease [Massilia sp. UBA6681]